MNIFLLSRTDNLNEELRRALRGAILERGGRVAYISSELKGGDNPYYLSTIQDYKALDESIDVDYFDLSQNFSDADLKKLTEYNVVYLSGGNTYTFLDSAKKREVKKILQKVLDNRGLLIGASAGSMMMTPTINLASSGDDNSVGLRDTEGFNFVSFEFYPHYTEEDNNFLSHYTTKNKIYLCRDGDGVFVSGNEIKKFGDIGEL
jgi:dipeptidase E